MEPIIKQSYQTGSFVEEGCCIYAVGDIHGRLDLLKKLEGQIQADIEQNAFNRNIIVYLGDYIDRGPESCGVIEHLIEQPVQGCESIYLLGNHEHALLSVLEGTMDLDVWMLWGGDATLQSYGLDIYHNIGYNSGQLKAEELRGRIPQNHLDFFRRLQLLHEEEGYIFVHAGLRPGVEVAKQSTEDLIFIRDDFIHSNQRFKKTVVFGHTIFNQPFVKEGRVGIDLGAFATGNLAAAVLHGETLRFLSTAS